MSFDFATSKTEPSRQRWGAARLAGCTIASLVARLSSATRNQSRDDLNRRVNRRLLAALVALVICFAAHGQCTNQFGTNRLYWIDGVASYLTTGQLVEMTNLVCNGLPKDFPAYDNRQAVAAKPLASKAVLLAEVPTMTRTNETAIQDLNKRLTMRGKADASTKRAVLVARNITP